MGGKLNLVKQNPENRQKVFLKMSKKIKKIIECMLKPKHLYTDKNI